MKNEENEFHDTQVLSNIGDVKHQNDLYEKPDPGDKKLASNPSTCHALVPPVGIGLFFITAGPMTRLSAWGEDDSVGHVL
jgi:hypothetical protein